MKYIHVRNVLFLIIVLISLTSCNAILKKIKIPGLDKEISTKDIDFKALRDYYKKNEKHYDTAKGLVVGVIVVYGLAQLLSKEDKKEVERTTAETVATGRTRRWINHKEKTSGQASVVKEEKKQEKIKIKVLKKKVKKVPPLEMVGQTYKAVKDSKVRGGPADHYEIVGNLSKGGAVNVVGKVKSSDWYFISQNGVGSGFMHQDLLVAAPEQKLPKSKQKADESELAEADIDVSKTCRTVKQTIKLADETEHTDTVEACQSANGWQVKERDEQKASS